MKESSKASCAHVRRERDSVRKLSMVAPKSCERFIQRDRALQTRLASKRWSLQRDRSTTLEEAGYLKKPSAASLSPTRASARLIFLIHRHAMGRPSGHHCHRAAISPVHHLLCRIVWPPVRHLHGGAVAARRKSSLWLVRQADPAHSGHLSVQQGAHIQRRGTCIPCRSSTNCSRCDMLGSDDNRQRNGQRQFTIGCRLTKCGR